MRTSFQMVALPYQPFAELFAKSDEELRSLGVRRMVADSRPGFPCRVSLQDAEVGETVVLLSFTHHDVPGPYQSNGPIYVREGAVQVTLGVNEIPPMLHDRLLSLRAYDSEGMLEASEVVQGRELEASIRRFFENEGVSYLHIHNAKPGCYNCSVKRA